MPEPAKQGIRFWLALHRVQGVGPATFAKLLARYESPEAVLQCSPAELAHCGLKDFSIKSIRNPDWQGVDRDLQWSSGANHHILTWHEPGYPAMLLESPAPPPLLYINGNVDILSQHQVAMVGSRNPTPAGRGTAIDFSRHLAAAGLAITSGLAIGIDSACHQGALDAGGQTIAVTGTGPDRIYPGRNKNLACRIAETGAIVSEYPTGTSPRPENFPRRNRIISGLAMGTLVVEAASRSGSLITAQHALEQGREVFAIPGSIHNPLSRGCHKLIRQGAKLVETADDIISELHPLAAIYKDSTQVTNNKELNTANLDHGSLRILEEMGYSPVPIDEIISKSGLTAEEVSSMMLFLELQGSVASSPGGCFIRVK